MSAEYDDVLTNQSVVIDNGSGIIKAGFAGQDHPKCFFPSFVGRLKHTRVLAGALKGDVFIGRCAQEFRGGDAQDRSVIVVDWDDMERVWSWVYPEELGTLSDEAVRALYSSGRTTGIVFDFGDGVTHAVPVFDGFSMLHSIRRVDVAGRGVTDYLQPLLRKAGHHLHTTAEREVVRAIKEKTRYIPLSPGKENETQVDREEYAGVHQVGVDSISRVDFDLRKSLFSNVILSGWSTLYQDLSPPERKLRKYSTWIGGSILAGLNTFKK
ncbi:actin-like ATPase domain-containing protein, partial [Auricularia subglabra TFB-10046 SS5]